MPACRQSGNVVFTSEQADTATIAAALERAIAEHLGVRPTVVVLTRAELARVVANNPFPEEPNPRWVHAIFRNGPFGPAHARWPRPQRAGRPAAPSGWFPNCRDGWHSPQLGNREQAAGNV
jgi:hypothetical protein